MNNQPKFLPEGRLPTLDDLFRSACQDPVIKTFVVMFQRGDLTLQQALIGMVLALLDQKSALFEQVEKMYLESSRPIVTPPPGKDTPP